MNNTLKITDRMLSNARANKMTGWLSMPPLDFLRLTISTSNVFDWIRQESSDTKSLADYNEYASSGDSTLMPWLDVDRSTGRVCGHEGRHRAIAVHNAGGTKFPVGICLRVRGYAVYYDTPDEDSLRKQFTTKEDVPKVFVGQFNHREIAVNTELMTEFWADRNR